MTDEKLEMKARINGLLARPKPRGLYTPNEFAKLQAGAEAEADRDYFELLKNQHDLLKSVLTLLDDGNLPRARAELQNMVDAMDRIEFPGFA